MNIEYTDIESLQPLREKQRRFFNSGVTRDIDFRRRMLKRLLATIKEEEPAVLEALAADLGKSAEEAYTNEVGFVYLEIRHILRNLKKWMKPRCFFPEIFLMPGRARVDREPYGSVLIIAPWNYPFQLLFAPLIEAIAAGNCVTAKPSEIAVNTAVVIERIIERTFDPEYAAVVQGGAETTMALIDQDYDYLFFTGSVPVGKKIMEAASRRLTPLTLELGGKSPVFVDASANLEVAAKRIVFGKFNNAGQTCIAPDYILADQGIAGSLVEELKKSIRKFYGDDPSKNGSYSRIINHKHFDRLSALLDGAAVARGGARDRSLKYFEPTLIYPADWSDPVMEDEIFGPILPVLTYTSLDEAIEQVRNRPKPLALYMFSKDRKAVKKITSSISFGGGCVNSTLLHVASQKLPFGGVGPSGMGRYHGRAGFETFTYEKGMLHQWPGFEPGFLHPHKMPRLKHLKKVIK